MKFKCPKKECSYSCTLEVAKDREAPKQCSYSGETTGPWQLVRNPELFGNSEQLPKLTAEVFNRPNCPEWAEYAAVDEDGEAYYFHKEPSEDNGLWGSHEGDDICPALIPGEFDATDYENSLIKRERKTSDGKLHVRFKKLHPDAKAPYQATAGSAGFDLTAVSKEENDYCIWYGTGLAVEIPEGHVGLVFPRSSIYKTGLLLTNSVGVIDSDYRGEISAVFTNIEFHKEYNVGDRIAQLVIMPIPAVKFEESEELTETKRGAGGYGSTGR